MDTTARVKLRPDTHYAPVTKGVYWSRPGGRSFVLAGPAMLYALIDAQHYLLADGTSVDEMVESIGDEASRPVLTHIVRTLLGQDMLFDLGTAGPAPDRATATSYADVIAYLEAQCPRPYEVFAKLRAAHVLVQGVGPAVDNLIRGLLGYGVDMSNDRAGVADLAILIDDADHPIDLAAAARDLPPGTPVLPVVTGTGLAAVGTVLGDPARVATFAAAVERFAGWVAVDDVGAAPRPLSAVFAGALAARAAIDALAGLDGTPSVNIVYGSTLECQRVPLDQLTDGPLWSDADTEEDLPLLAVEPVPAEAPQAPEAAADEPAAVASESQPAEDPVLPKMAPLTARWTGYARWGDDLDLPQLPIALATVRPIDPAAPAHLGWGIDRGDAGIDALLSMWRSVVAAGVPGEPDWALGAGVTPRRFLADGLLRLTAGQLLAEVPAVEIAPGEIGAWIVRSLWGALHDYFDMPVRLWSRELPGLRWPLITATDADGQVRTHQWGPNRASAAHAALSAVTAGCQLTEDPSTAVAVDPVGAWALRTASSALADQCFNELVGVHAASGRKLTARLLHTDPVIGRLPLYAGWVGLR